MIGTHISHVRIYKMSSLFWEKYILLEKQSNPFSSPRLTCTYTFKFCVKEMEDAYAAVREWAIDSEVPLE